MARRRSSGRLQIFAALLLVGGLYMYWSRTARPATTGGHLPFEDDHPDSALAQSGRAHGAAAGADTAAGSAARSGAQRGAAISRRGAQIIGKADENHMHGDAIGLRPDGTPGLPVIPYVSMKDETLEMKRKAHEINCFNLKRSDSLDLNRPVPDYRDRRCLEIKYPADLPKTSVIFVFFNEPLSPLLRSVHSVLNRTPPQLLHEIVLVDDGSTADWLGKPLEDYLKLLPDKFKLVRRPKRSGLMDARTDGAKAATGETITFLDSHIEVSPGWLEPLMARIKEDRRHVVMPIIDSIDADSLTYNKGGLDILGFSWSLGQKSIGSRRRTRTEPMPSPIMAGGLFTMDRALFFDLGGYDPEMKLYGGEEMEISFRIWQCGNTLECIPCSRVGHIFRTGQFWHGQVYHVPGEVIVKNKLRAAAVWMDEYADIVRQVMPPLPRGMELGDLSYMQEIRRKHNCKPFKWLLDNVYPEMFVPNDPSKMAASGEIRNPETNSCFDTLGGSHQGSQIGAYSCHGGHGTQQFVLSKRGDLRPAVQDFAWCLDRGGGVQNAISMWPCHESGGNQGWKWNPSTGHLSDMDGSSCAEVRREPTSLSPFKLIMAPCETGNPRQTWTIADPSARPA